MSAPREIVAEHALAVLRAMGAAPGQDFFTLSASQVCIALEEADRVKYRKPKNANGSRGRYFYALLQRRARWTDDPYQPKTGEACSCRRGVERDNCPSCEGTGQRIDFARIRRG